MAFNSIEFVTFLILLLLIVRLASNVHRWKILLIGGIILLLSWNYLSLILVLYTSFINYYYAHKIGSTNYINKKKILFVIDILLSLLPLIIFKYMLFLFEIIGFQEINSWNLMLQGLSLGVPIGLSFYSFQNIAYTFDVYRGSYCPEEKYGHYLLYSSFIPIQVSGPIERAGNLLPQLKSKININNESIIVGAKLLIWGYFKKTVIADSLATVIDPVFKNPNGAIPYAIIIGVFLYSIQIYADFSGYIDIARGIAKMFGINLSLNFMRPYSARSIREFWHLWHITLSRWFRDYLYIPLGGKKNNLVKWIISIIMVFSVSGLWHGANMHYIVWGMLHAWYYIVGMLTFKRRDIIYNKLFGPKVIDVGKQITNYFLITFAWIFFRANSLNDAFDLIRNVYYKILSLIINNFTTEDVYQIEKTINNPQFIITILLLGIFVTLNSKKINCRMLSAESAINPKIYDLIVVNIMIICIILLGSNNTREFIYMKY